MTDADRAMPVLMAIEADSAYPRPVRYAAKVAISALHAQQEREKGCECCRERKPILEKIGMLQIDETDSTLWFTQHVDEDITDDHTDIHFCPMCGRKLVEE